LTGGFLGASVGGMKKSDVLKFFGSVKLVAKALDISTQSVYAWGNHVPASSAYKLEVVTGGKLCVKR